LKACSMALQINKVLSSDQNLFNRELSHGYEKLCDELYPFVGAITGAPGVMGCQRALQITKPRGAQPTTSPAKPDSFNVPNTPYRAVVNGSLIPSVMNDRRKSRRMKKSGSVSGSGSYAVGSAAGNSSTGSAKMQKSETIATISLSLAQKRADESVDGDPNSLTGVGVQTPQSARPSRKTGRRLSVLSPVNPSASGLTSISSSSSSSSALAASSTTATPLKARVPSCDSSQSMTNDDDTSSVSSIGSDSDEEAGEMPEVDEAKRHSKKGDHAHTHRHRHHKPSME